MHRGFLRLNSRRYRRLLLASLATLGIAGGVFGTIVAARWRAHHAVQGETRVVLNQAAQQLVRSLQSRRGTLTLLRDTLNKAPNLSLAEQQALAKSAVSHTRHLLGAGLIQPTTSLAWWVEPGLLTPAESTRLTRAITQRAKQTRQTWKVPSTFTLFLQLPRPLLIMLEPVRTPSGAIVGVFELPSLLKDFFELTLQQPYPVQVREGEQALYESRHWQPAAPGQVSPIIERPLRLDGLHWTLRMQPGPTQTMQMLSSFSSLLVGISVMAGAAAIGLIWILAMRTWVLQRAVSRRTAALRRTTDRLRQLAVTDELTGLHNRRFFLERWEFEFERAKRYQRPLVCLMIDINHFKQINDLLGHHTGDLVLKRVAAELKTCLRTSDILSRFGGDEFIVALPETSLEQAMAVAEKIRVLRIEGPWMRHAALGPVRLSVGLGEAERHLSTEDVIQRADRDLYASRRRVQKTSS